MSKGPENIRANFTQTSDGKCLYVDKLSGDFRANLTPVQVGTCGATDGQGWDIITAGKHNDQKGTMLVVNTLTQACMNFDPRRAAGNQVNLFSCGGRADGGSSLLESHSLTLKANLAIGGRVTNSQLFTFTGGSGPLSLKPVNEVGSCFTVKGNAIDVAQCSSGDEKQDFAIGGGAGSGNDAADGKPASSSTDAATTTTAGDAATTLASQAPEATTADNAASSSSKCTQRTRTVTVTPSASTSAAVTIKAPVSTTDTSSSVTAIETGEALSPTETDPLSSDTTSGPPPTTTTSPSGSSGGTEGGSPTASIPVSRAGGVLNPSAAAESHRRDETATRAFASVEIRAPNGQCLSADPTAGDFRQNLIPVALVDCSGADGEKWDVITAGKHNNADGAVIVVSALVSSNSIITVVDGKSRVPVEQY